MSNDLSNGIQSGSLSRRSHNFNAGPVTLPLPVLQQAQAELLDYHGTGMSLMESYPGQDAPLHSVGSWSLILARRDLPEETGYRLARALHRGEAELASRLAQARDNTAANTAEVADPALLHPGARRYLREMGALRQPP